MRFGVNTTVGILGFFDPATKWGLEKHPEDFGQTLAHYGGEQGFYLVLPFVGPGTGLDCLGRLIDYPFDLSNYLVGAGPLISINEVSGPSKHFKRLLTSSPFV